MSRPIAVLRPEPGNRATAAAIEAAGRTAIRMPLFAAGPVAWHAPDPAAFDALLLTSANALRHGGPQLGALRSLPVHAVGSATAAAARHAGFAIAFAGTGDGAALIAAAEAAGVRRALLLGGRTRMLDAGGIVARAITVYASEPLAIAPERAARLHGAIALVQSARAGARLAELVAPGHRATIGIAAISPRAAGAAGPGWGSVAIAADMQAATLIALALQLAD
ncbi:uroporphyrinogen-III synthase [Nostoc ellipsosporum NOK]|uniref:uroporphyrinogen-III synthase n=1 Tax=Sphingomonas sp. IBVSS2 TaxID=1985172 RepID=UPI000A2D66A8|nr:uroporphyrinogen-III synthase [Sphingomonas sp. IBVSS2]MDF2381976.1 uroporphyrinogen-III synthase [Nostoc ellipsosporum NOK]OSZ69790.1 uroporphyrinogen-III synthase [Sphingomonas sp. IBVSS2]